MRARRPPFLRPRAALLGVLLAGAPAASPAVLAQDPETPPAAAVVERIALELPASDSVRDASGAPGPAYWQQRADYRIRVTLDPQTHRISGSETISYTNNSPDTLTSLWLQLDQNLFDPDSPEARQTPEDSRFSGAFRGGGFQISRVAAGEGGRPLEHRVDGTVMEVALDEPLPPGGARLDLHIDFSFVVPERGADRTGRFRGDGGTVYEIAQWYPRMFVYDDVHGWNALPYLGQGEWYLEYGDFEVEITVPRELLVVATGELQNPEEVLTQEQRRRLEEARRSETTVRVVAPEEVGRRGTRPQGEGPLTWRFRAEGVRDFAWAASRAFVWDAASWEDVLVMAAYPRNAMQERFGPPGWEDAVEHVRHAVAHYSERWSRYPYPVAIAVAGGVLGMEYPMIVFCDARFRGDLLFSVIDHEVAHAWFPMLVGSDERRHAWMDEGLVTFGGIYSEEERFGEVSPGNMASPALVGRLMGSELGEKPVATYPDSLSEDELGFLAYAKTGAALWLLREYVLGAERFDPAFRAYIERWAGKHPTPADFFRTMEDVAEEDLGWFWRGWFLEAGVLDQAVAGVERAGDTTTVRVANRGDVLMPLEVRFIYGDGTDECLRLPVSAWGEDGEWSTEIVDRELRNVQVDPRGMLPDVNPHDNVWGRGVVARQDRC